LAKLELSSKLPGELYRKLAEDSPRHPLILGVVFPTPFFDVFVAIDQIRNF
jgi:hypothetical protein